MTAQFAETLIYKGEHLRMATEPLEKYLSGLEDGSPFRMLHTACWRGYQGTWELKDNKLYLVDLTGRGADDKEVGMDYLFPNQKEKFADWFSGEIRIQQGEQLEYVHMGYESVYEKDLFLEFKDGVLVSENVVDNKERVANNKEITENQNTTTMIQRMKGVWGKLF